MIKDAMVYLDGTPGDEGRIAYAEHLAQAFDAFLTGLYVNQVPELLGVTDPFAGTSMIEDLQAEAVATGNKAAEMLKHRLERLAVSSELRRLDVYPGTAGDILASEARTADVFVATRPYGDPAAAGTASLAEAVLFGSGRSCLFVPPTGAPPEVYDRIVVGWTNTREAARAVSEALPLLARASSVVVALVDEAGAPEARQVEPGADIARHLGRHGVKVELRNVAGWGNAGDALLNEITSSGAQMIVIGGYGHSRLREFVVGGVTRHLLSTAPVPILIAH